MAREASRVCDERGTRGSPASGAEACIAVQADPATSLVQRLCPVSADMGTAKMHAVRMVWPIVCRRLEGLPNLSATQLFEELSIQFPGGFPPAQYKSLPRRANRWRADARARGADIGPKTYRRLSNKPIGRRKGLFEDDWPEMTAWLEAQPDQTVQELLVEVQARYPGRHSDRQVYTPQRYVRKWRKQEIQRF